MTGESGWRYQVHPRVGGETAGRSEIRPGGGGPSPRGRGNPVIGLPGDDNSGSIPAWAGKPRRRPRSEVDVRVHPRVGGETFPDVPPPSSPSGPSPRGRGNHLGRTDTVARGRSIPAWAGKPHTQRGCRTSSRVHPRVGGETRDSDGDTDSDTGPSPRGRGNLGMGRRGLGDSRSIPAWAGKPRYWCGAIFGRKVHPRVGGETHGSAGMLLSVSGPSPRGRGNHHRREVLIVGDRSIPAWAGKPQRRRNERGQIGVHPRVGGETPS